MSNLLISTKEVAAMLNVTETTIKRWADENVLNCVRTHGGHRKFFLKDVVQFAENNGFTVGGSQPPPMSRQQMERLQVGVHTHDYAKIATVLKEEALQSDREGLTMLLLYLYKRHIPLPVVLDRIVLPAFAEIGRDWEKGELGIDQEHAASHALAEALVRTAPELHRKKPNNKLALCACPEGELHELGLLGLAYSLECEGWGVYYLGGNTPVESIASVARVKRPDLVCLSLTSAEHGRNLSEGLRKLASTVHAYNGKFLLGGQSTHTLSVAGIEVDHIAASIQDAISYSREVFQLKPGPKKQTKRVEQHP